MAGLFNSSLETITPALLKRSRMLYSGQQRRFRDSHPGSLPYSLDDLRVDVIIPGLRESRCPYCGDFFTEASFVLDHITPIDMGGAWTTANLVACCASCNTIKGILDAEEYAALRHIVGQFAPAAAADLYRRIKIGSNPMAARLISGR